MSTTDRSYRSPLGRVRGLGSAKDGAGHWLTYRLLSLAYIPLVIWFVFAVIGLKGEGYIGVVAFLKDPVNATLMLLTVGVTFHHAAYGMQEVFEDYIHGKLAKTLVIAATKGICLLLAVACAFAVLKTAFSPVLGA